MFIFKRYVNRGTILFQVNEGSNSILYNYWKCALLPNTELKGQERVGAITDPGDGQLTQLHAQ
jgi:hypothetical protein